MTGNGNQISPSGKTNTATDNGPFEDGGSSSFLLPHGYTQILRAWNIYLHLPNI